MKHLITNVVYGNIYAELFLTQHLKSMLDESNLPAFKGSTEYLVFSDKETTPRLEAHENFKKLRETVPTEIMHIGWPEGEVDRFGLRYTILTALFHESVKLALKKEAYLSAIVADLVVARDFLPKLNAKIDEGYHAVFMQPPRCAAEVTIPELNKYPRAMYAEDLWRLCYHNMHPLWVACHWRAAQFTKLPFQLLWNSGQGILCRSFSITPLMFKPNEKMLESRGMIDGDVPHLIDNPFWATDWTDAPIVGVEPLFCYYPPFANHTAEGPWVKEWMKCLHETQPAILKQRLYYPNKESAGISEALEFTSNVTVDSILE